MINIIQCNLNNLTEYETLEDILALIHSSFQERLDAGMNFCCSFWNIEDLKKILKDAVIWLVYSEKSLCGISAIKVYNNKSTRSGKFEFTAISTNYKNRGLASILAEKKIKYLQEQHCEYILSDTSVHAKSSIKYHLKNGFKIVGLESWEHTNYYSYMFRLQLKPSVLYNSSIFVKLIYYRSFLKCHILRKSNGQPTLIGKVYYKTKYVLSKLKSLC